MKNLIRGMMLMLPFVVISFAGPTQVRAEEAVDQMSIEAEASTTVDAEVEVSESDENSTETDKQMLEEDLQEEETQAEETQTEDKYSLTRDDKFRRIVERSYSHCKVCQDIDDHIEHMAMDSVMRKFLWDPEKYYDSEEVDIIWSDGIGETELVCEDVTLETDVVNEENSTDNDEDIAVDNEEIANEANDEADVVIEVVEPETMVNETIEPDISGVDAAEDESPAIESEEMRIAMPKNVENTSIPELELLYRLVESEAGIESAKCKEMVAAVVLNRVHSDKFPNTIHDVIYAPGAFAVTNNNAINHVKVTQETKNAVNVVYYGQKQMPENIYFFRNKHYFSWCKPVMSIDHTYFSTFK